jgi:hypothetical protein
MQGRGKASLAVATRASAVWERVGEDKRKRENTLKNAARGGIVCFTRRDKESAGVRNSASGLNKMGYEV